MKWFRLYSEFAFDPKVQSMTETLQRRYIMLLCLKCNGDLVTCTDDEIAFALHITPEELQETKKTFLSKKFIDEDWNIINWDKRQYVSDSSKERVKRHRQKQLERQPEECNDDVTLPKRYGNGSVTPPDTDTDTDTDTEVNTQKEKINKKEKVNSLEFEGFDQLWGVYPLKVGKEAARKAFAKIRPPPDLLQIMLTAVHKQHTERILADRHGCWHAEWKHLATWLNGKNWEDETNLNEEHWKNEASRRNDRSGQSKNAASAKPRTSTQIMWDVCAGGLEGTAYDPNRKRKDN